MARNHTDLPRVAFWLVPRYQERILIQSLIMQLAGRFSAPVFVPHVTVYSCRRSTRQQELALMLVLAASCQPFAVHPLGLDSSSRLTQALFWRLPEHPAIIRLSQSLHNGVPLPSTYRLAPHLSLLYRELAAAVGAALLVDLNQTPPEIYFDTLWAVAIPGQIKTSDDLLGWQPLLISRLDSGAIVDNLDN